MQNPFVIWKVVVFKAVVMIIISNTCGVWIRRS